MFGLSEKERLADIIQDESERIASKNNSFRAEIHNYHPDLMAKWSLDIDANKINILYSVLAEEHERKDFFSIKFAFDNVRKGIEKSNCQTLYEYRLIGRLAELHASIEDESNILREVMEISSEDISAGYSNISKKEVYDDIEREAEEYFEENMFGDKLDR